MDYISAMGQPLLQELGGLQTIIELPSQQKKIHKNANGILTEKNNEGLLIMRDGASWGGPRR